MYLPSCCQLPWKGLRKRLERPWKQMAEACSCESFCQFSWKGTLELAWKGLQVPHLQWSQAPPLPGVGGYRHTSISGYFIPPNKSWFKWFHTSWSQSRKPCEVAPEVDAFASVDPLRHSSLLVDSMGETTSEIGNQRGNHYSEIGHQSLSKRKIIEILRNPCWSSSRWVYWAGIWPSRQSSNGVWVAENGSTNDRLVFEQQNLVFNQTKLGMSLETNKELGARQPQTELSFSCLTIPVFESRVFVFESLTNI